MDTGIKTLKGYVKTLRQLERKGRRPSLSFINHMRNLDDALNKGYGPRYRSRHWRRNGTIIQQDI